MARANRHITDAKWNTKKRLKSIRGKLESIAAEWGDIDFFISSKIEGPGALLDQIDEILEEVDGVDVSNH